MKMEAPSPRPPTVPPRLQSFNHLAPPVPSRWDLCTLHSGNKYTAICTTCVKFLCRACLMSELYYHQNCSVCYIDDNISEACQELRGSLNDKLDVVCKTLTDFHRSLSKKRERMLTKRNETKSEIDRYFSQLKDRLMRKLERQQNVLLDVLNTKVNEQDVMISDRIELLDRTLNNLEEKRAMIQAQARHCRRGGNPISLFKNLVNTVNDIQSTENLWKDITAVRDAFLVIRFFVNSEIEQSLLNSNVACVEVLSSRSNSRHSASLESERINEASLESERINEASLESDRINEASNIQCMSSSQTDVPQETYTDTDVHSFTEESSVTSDNLSDFGAVGNVDHSLNTESSHNSHFLNAELRVNLPLRTNDIEPEPREVETHFDTINDADAPIDAIREFCDDQESHPETEMSDRPMSEATLPQTETHADEIDSRHLESYGDGSENIESYSLDVMEETNEVESGTCVQIADQDAETEADEPSASTSLTQNEYNARGTIQEQESLDLVRDDSCEHDRDESSSPFYHTVDDPPPPYPGLPASPVPPAPDELPPPYPGGPPPPYSQNLESLQPLQPRIFRPRLNGESDRPLSTLSRAVSPQAFGESNVPVLLRDLPIVPPNQTHTPRLSRPKVGKTFSVNEANDRRTSGIFALAFVKDDAFVVVDRWNKKLKHFSSAGVSRGGLIFPEEPWDLTVMNEELVAVTVPKLETIHRIQVTKNSVIPDGTVPCHRKYACLSYCRNPEVFVCGQVPQFGEPVIDVIDALNGQIVKSFRSQYNVHQIRLSYPRYVKVDEQGTVIVCDWNLKCLTVFKLDGTMVGIYRGTVEFPLNEPSGITYNEQTQEIYVIDAKHNSTQGAVHKLSKDCVCKEIVRFDNEFRIARAIAPHGSSYALGNKSGIVSIFSRRSRR